MTGSEMIAILETPGHDLVWDQNKTKKRLEYISWSVGQETATLDGDFTLDQLRAIVDHMDRYR